MLFRSVVIDLPYPMTYTDEHGAHRITRTRCHRLAADNFLSALYAIRGKKLEGEANDFGGIYNNRTMRGRGVLPSTHSWGIAIDLEPARFPLGSKDRLPDAVVECFRKAGFFYGGDFKTRLDPQHFQLARGY